MPVELIPFGSVETADRKIHWPPGGDSVMNAFGFKEASRHAIDVMLPGRAQTRLVSLAGLALLKIVSWEDRVYPTNGKHATDLNLIARNYLTAGNEDRLFNDFGPWTQEVGFDYDTFGARMLGHDMQRHLNHPEGEPIARILATQSDCESANTLPIAMDQHNPERALRLLEQMLIGLRSKAE
jgi:predicted nucleotidyltransferase